MDRKRLIAVGVFVAALILLALFISINNSPKAAPADVKIESDFVGISTHWLKTEDALLVKESGAGWIRIDTSENFSEAVVSAKAQNLSVLGILDSWLFNGDWENFTLVDWQVNVTNCVSEYAGLVDAWEIWNEPSSLVFPVPVEKYFEMVKIASPIIRQYDPSAKIVLCGGLLLFSNGSLNLDVDKGYAKNLSDYEISRYGDAISVHAYPCGNNGDTFWKGYAESLNYYRSLFGSLEVWVTETGKPLHEGNQEIQGQYLSEAYKFFARDNIYVSKVFWYILADDSLENGIFGLTLGNQTTPAYQALQKITGIGT